MRPSSTNVPSPKRSTRDSSTALSPAAVATAARTPSGPSTVDSVWLGAVERAWRVLADPGSGAARPLNSSANTSSRISEDDDAAGQLAGGERAEGLVGLVEAIAARDELVDLQLAGEIEGG